MLPSVCAGIENDLDILALDKDIEKLRRTNIQKEAEVIRIRAEVVDIEKQKLAHENETESLTEKKKEVTECLDKLKVSLIKSLQNIHLPNCDDKFCDDTFDSYIGRLQQLCIDRVSPENKMLFCAVKSALAAVKTV